MWDRKWGLAGAVMRWAILLFCYLVLAFTIAGAGTPLLASDLEPPRQTYPGDGPRSEAAPIEREVAEFCLGQRRICRKVCYLRFRDDLVGCPQSCESRVTRCIKKGCYRWTEPEFVIAENFGGYQCPH